MSIKQDALDVHMDSMEKTNLVVRISIYAFAAKVNENLFWIILLKVMHLRAMYINRNYLFEDIKGEK